MQLKVWGRTAALAVAMTAVCAQRCSALPELDDRVLEYMLRYFTDSGHVNVRSSVGDYSFPLKGDAALSVHWNNEKVTIPAVSAPIGSQQAIDAITTASRPIAGNAFQDFVKVRNEFKGDVTKGPLDAEYYVSSESDYLGQQLGATFNRDFKDQQLNFAVGSSYGWDKIDPLADDDAHVGPSHKNTMHVDFIATDVLSPTTLLRAGVEYNIVDGLQHNPYRNVYAGGSQVPERHPDHRARRDAFFKLNQYLPNRSSLKATYRFYDDDWGIQSHELGTKLSQYITQGVSAAYEYRYYTQTAADFYRPEYATTDGIDGYLTGDYRMTALSSHLFGASLNFDLFGLAEESKWLRRMGVSLNYQRYFNSNNYTATILETGLTYRF